MKLFFICCLVVFFSPVCSYAQVADNSVKVSIIADSSTNKQLYKNVYKNLLDSNLFLYSKGAPQALNVLYKNSETNQSLFYLIASLLFFLGLLRTVFSRYFSTLFRVFFNTSLRQNQLTDQLEQATLPSLLFNIFFVISAGLYVYLLQDHFSERLNSINYNFLGICFLAVAVCYGVKYFTLLFTGWVTNYLAEARVYIFIVFLVNKIIGIFLLPFLLLMAFSSSDIAGYAIFVSFIFLSVILLSRFFRAYSLLQNRLKLNFFHFVLYIFALEILPIVLIYKLVVMFFGKIL